MARILVLDDVPEIVMGLHSVLETAGHEVVGTGTVKDALDALSRRPVDVVVTDIFMPERDGLEFIKELRVRYPDIRIIAISGGASRFPADPFLSVAQRFGSERTLLKPFKPATLLEVISELLSS